MGEIKHFTDLEAWKEVHKLTLVVYKLSKSFPKEEIYALTSQLRRAAVSVESCIAEGFSRYHFKDRLTFYYDARGSIGEVQSQILTARDVEYISNNQYEEAFKQAEKTGIILGGLIRSTISLTKRKIT